MWTDLTEMADEWEAAGYTMLERDDGEEFTPEEFRAASAVAQAFFTCASQLRQAINDPDFDYESRGEFVSTGLWRLRGEVGGMPPRVAVDESVVVAARRR